MSPQEWSCLFKRSGGFVEKRMSRRHMLRNILKPFKGVFGERELQAEGGVESLGRKRVGKEREKGSYR